MTTARNIVLIGPPGAGKGTHAQLLKKELGIPHLSTGDMLRQAAATGSELGLKIKALIDGGNFVPDEVMVPFVVDKIDSPECKNGFILDGFPRTLPQADALDKILAKTGEEVTATVSIMIPDEMIMERIKGRALKEGRADDASEEIINTRIVTYHNQTEPLIEYYTKAGKYNEVDGTGTIDEVRDRIFTVMDKF